MGSPVETNKKNIVVEPERIERLREALRLASEAKFAESQRLLEDSGADDMADVEQDLQAFILDMKTAVDYNAETIHALTASKKELRALSTPIIDVWDGVIAAPLVGQLERDRVEDLSERMLRRIAEARITWVLLDMTGIDLVDSDIANHLLRLARSIGLMGARCILTGLRPRVAHAFVTLGISLDELHPAATLKEGLKRCIGAVGGPATR